MREPGATNGTAPESADQQVQSAEEGDDETPGEQRPRFRSILVDARVSPAAEYALSLALQLAQTHQSRLTLMTAPATRLKADLPIGMLACGPVWVTSFSPTVIDLALSPRRHVAAESETRDRLESLLAGVETSGPVTAIVRDGNPTTALVERALGADHDLVVLGAANAAQRLYSCLVGWKIARRANVPVAIASEQAVDTVDPKWFRRGATHAAAQ